MNEYSIRRATHLVVDIEPLEWIKLLAVAEPLKVGLLARREQRALTGERLKSLLLLCGTSTRGTC